MVENGTPSSEEIRFRVIKRLAEKHGNAGDEIKAAAKELNLSNRQIYRLIDAVRKSPYADAVSNMRNCPGTSNSRLGEKVEQIILSCLKELFCGTGEKITSEDVFALVVTRCADANENPPSPRTIRRRVAKFLDHLGDRSNGRKRRKRLRGGRLVIKQPFSWVQADHTMIDVILDLSAHGLGLRRPWLTLIVDVTTRLIYGYYIGLCRPTTRSLMFAVLQGVLPKRTWLEGHGISWTSFEDDGIADVWPVNGLFKLLSCDNDKTFKNQMVSRAAAYLGFETHYRPVATPHYGGHIERLIGTMMGKMHLLPGTTLSNVVTKGDYDAEANAMLSLEQLEQFVLLSIAEYHLTVHRALNCTPLQRYEELKHKVPRTALAPIDPFRLQLAFLPREGRTVRNDRIRLSNRHYYHPGLNSLQGKRVSIIYRPWDMRTVSLSLDGRSEHLCLDLVPDGSDIVREDVWKLSRSRPDLIAESRRQQAIAYRIRAQKLEWLSNLKLDAKATRHSQSPRQIGQIIREQGLTGDLDASAVLPFPVSRPRYE